MEKLKKYQKVENYLNKLLLREDFSMETLSDLKYKDMLEVDELAGIGDRTISNVLTDFKLKKGLQLKTNKFTKKQKVEQYLSDKMKTGELTVKELLKMRYQDLKDIPELTDVGKTTLTCTLSAFKKSHDPKTFEKGVLDFLEKEQVQEQPVFQTTANKLFVDDDIHCIKKMIREYKDNNCTEIDKQVFELSELKHALNHVGINPQKIVRLYWEYMSNDYINQQIFPTELSATSDMQLNQAV